MATLIIIAITVIVSIRCFSNRELFYKLSLNPYSIDKRKQWYRVITHAFVHADYVHLFVNMFVLWSFGSSIENSFEYFNSLDLLQLPTFYFVLLYFLGVVFSSIPDVFKYKNNAMYNSIGASGGVSAVLFASIFLNPWSKIYLFAIIPIPSIVFGIAYIAYSQYMDKHSNGNTNHKAHIFGAIFGFIYMAMLNHTFITNFINQLFFRG